MKVLPTDLALQIGGHVVHLSLTDKGLRTLLAIGYLRQLRDHERKLREGIEVYNLSSVQKFIPSSGDFIPSFAQLHSFWDSIQSTSSHRSPSPLLDTILVPPLTTPKPPVKNASNLNLNMGFLLFGRR